MSIIMKHEVRSDLGRYEVWLYLNRKELEDEILETMAPTIKSRALQYIHNHFPELPVQVVRVYIGSLRYFSFALNKHKNLSPLT
ncbi:hypothetical protein N781_16590 [Pontibacillus halophilus JSM 076056 = DSM 19796]|uniref:Uncharacterized protein n=1 Tax=Pontibacillus halophilus JSM 076056 = DSM 19796 TaxID=1385510 RepID=A0A0A5GKM6_9BACI|nr:hypothetical protein [Pontibacillus halophilus]KGX92494.1 hypothetical protein N781_16590 [Pontibacillus halophilus JSM 076056 = DSM 19796]